MSKPQPSSQRARLSRPARIHDLEAATRELIVEYQRWLDALPENLAESEMAEQLSGTIEQLEDVAEGLAAIDPPVIGPKRSGRMSDAPRPDTLCS